MQNYTHLHSGDVLYMEKSDTFCSAIWSNVHITPAGDHKPCCAWPTSLEFDRDTVKQQANNNQHIEGCANCYAYEANNQTSLRSYFNYILEPTDHITSVDLSVDNVCNYECVMCSSEYSNKAAHREIKLLGNTVAPQRLLRSEEYKNIDWTHVDTVKFFGGEPLVSPGFARFVDWSKSHVNWQNMHVEIVTNNSVTPSDQYHAIFKNCKTLRVVISRDGLDQVNQFHRPGAPALADEIPRFDYWQTLRPDPDISINSAVGIYNALDQDQMIAWFAQYYPAWKINLEMIQSPGFLDLRNMPKELKQEYAQHIKDKRILDWMHQEGTDQFRYFASIDQALYTLYKRCTSTINPVLYKYTQKHKDRATFEEIKQNYV